MMKRFWTTLLSGLVFLLPLLVVGFLLVKFFELMKWFTAPLNIFTSPDTLAGVMVANVMAILLLFVVIFLIGCLARSFMGRKMEKSMDTFLSRFVPGYNIVRGLSAQINDDEEKLPVVLVRQDDGASIGFEIERNKNGWVSVFLPGSPQAHSGSVILMSADRVVTLELPYAKAVYMFQQMGKGSTAYLPDVNAEIELDKLVQGHRMQPANPSDTVKK